MKIPRDPLDRQQLSWEIAWVLVIAFVLIYGIVQVLSLVRGKMEEREQARRRAWEITYTQDLVDALAEGFAANDDNGKHLIGKWARGELRDAWDNVPVLVENSYAAVIVASKGPDGKLGTEDDIPSATYNRDRPAYMQKKKLPKRSVVERAQALVERAQALVDRFLANEEK